MNQNSVIAFGLIVGFIVFVTVRGELPAYLAVLLGNQSTTQNASTLGGLLGGVLGSTGTGGITTGPNPPGGITTGPNPPGGITTGPNPPGITTGPNPI
jgi:hypothetical protein